MVNYLEQQEARRNQIPLTGETINALFSKAQNEVLEVLEGIQDYPNLTDAFKQEIRDKQAVFTRSLLAPLEIALFGFSREEIIKASRANGDLDALMNLSVPETLGQFKKRIDNAVEDSVSIAMKYKGQPPEQRAFAQEIFQGIAEHMKATADTLVSKQSARGVE